MNSVQKLSKQFGKGLIRDAWGPGKMQETSVTQLYCWSEASSQQTVGWCMRKDSEILGESSPQKYSVVHCLQFSLPPPCSITDFLGSCLPRTLKLPHAVPITFALNLFPSLEHFCNSEWLCMLWTCQEHSLCWTIWKLFTFDKNESSERSSWWSRSDDIKVLQPWKTKII